jgi:uncharacterized protein YraI
MLLAAAMIAGCAGAGLGPEPTATPGPVKTLRPTFTHTPAKPTEPPATATPEVPPTETPVPATATPDVPPTETPVPATATPEAATLTITSQTANLRDGPGTGYGRFGQVKAGETYPVTGRNPAGDWWEIDFNGEAAWIYSQMATVAGADLVAVAENVPVLPTARPVAAAPKPAAKPAPQPTAPPAAPSYQFAAVGSAFRPNTNDWLTVRCRTKSNVASKDASPGILQVNGPVSAPAQPFGGSLVTANTGMETNMQYMYNDGCKVELRPYVAGSYTAFLVDGGGKQISDPITFATSGDQREVVLMWNPR